MFVKPKDAVTVTIKTKLWADLTMKTLGQHLQMATQDKRHQSHHLALLRIFAETCPVLLVHHVSTLHSLCFSKTDSTADEDRVALQSVIKIFELVLPAFRGDVLPGQPISSFTCGDLVLDSPIVNDIEYRLMDMCLKQPTPVNIHVNPQIYEQIVQCAIRCLAVICEQLTSNRTLLLRLLARCVGMSYFNSSDF
jgi:hypothetical protein